ncbi:hypothetical protein ACFQZ4_33205 [Catellatospora coxensis]
MSSTSPAPRSWLTNQSAQRVRARVAIAVAAAVVALSALATPAAADGTPTPGTERSKTSFVIGMKQDIDSLNPYVGVVSAAYESYRLMYDYLIGNSARTSPRRRSWPRAGRPRPTARPGPTTCARASSSPTASS